MEGGDRLLPALPLAFAAPLLPPALLALGVPASVRGVDELAGLELGGFDDDPRLLAGVAEDPLGLTPQIAQVENDRVPGKSIGLNVLDEGHG